MEQYVLQTHRSSPQTIRSLNPEIQNKNRGILGMRIPLFIYLISIIEDLIKFFFDSINSLTSQICQKQAASSRIISVPPTPSEPSSFPQEYQQLKHLRK